MTRYVKIVRHANGWAVEYKCGGDDVVTVVYSDAEKPAFLTKIAHLLGADFLPG